MKKGDINQVHGQYKSNLLFDEQEKEKETEKVLLARGNEDLEVALFGISAFRLG